MRFTFLLIATVCINQVGAAQNGTATLTPAQANVTMSVSDATPTASAASTENSTSSATSSEEGQVTYLDYKSVYEAATIEEEVKMAAERFQLTKSQQEVWLVAAGDRRASEKRAKELLDSKAGSYEKEGIYRGLRTSLNTFHETVVGYLSPAQKQAYETDRLILQEKQRRIAKLPPPPPPAPTVTVAPVDSAAIKETEKGKGKKSKKKKKAVTS